MYMYVCLRMHCTRLSTPYASPCRLPITSAPCACPLEHWLQFGTPLWGVALLLGMADGASLAEDSSDDDSDLSRVRTATGHRKCPDDDSDLGTMCIATKHGKRSWSQTAAQRKERLAAEQLRYIPFFTTSLHYTGTFPYTSFSLLHIHTVRISHLCYYSSFKFINCCMAGCEACVYALRIPSYIRTFQWNFLCEVSGSFKRTTSGTWYSLKLSLELCTFFHFTLAIKIAL